MIAERTANGCNTTQSRYGPHFQAINHRLRALGLKTYTQGGDPCPDCPGGTRGALPQ
ncbi:MAG: hypothetical protein M5R42_04835 [Rhodocyclaceae bacterium]|nr:hypothetical protein [Rhodocyclaceae bacterium]